MFKIKNIRINKFYNNELYRDWNRKSNYFKIFFIDDQLDFESVSNFSRNDQHLADIGNFFGVKSAYM
jgi:hypothetical protein